MIITTTHSVEDRRITAYLGIVCGNAVMGTNIFSDMLAKVRDIVGGRSGAYENALREAKDAALADLAAQAQALGADAVIGLSLNFETIGGDGKTMLIASANGTAVKLG
ncbi:MAG: heavy metal-binding domain-containing protein [Magnetospirillum sp.]|nr:heavy metal-binding domain-containing protein [Magnetospirillum sp.]